MRKLLPEKKFVPGLHQMCFAMELDNQNKVNSFEEIGMLNPFHTKKSAIEATMLVKTFDWQTEIYPDQVIRQLLEAVRTQDKVKPPKTIFIPTKSLCQTMIRALVEFGEKEPLKKLLVRFGLEETEKL